MWIFAPFVMGIGATALMFALGFVMALGSMAGPIHVGDDIIMLYITIPASLISAFLARRAGFLRSIAGAFIFSAPIVLVCYTVDPTGPEHSRVLHQVAHTTVGFALLVSVFFAVAARVTKKENHAA